MGPFLVALAGGSAGALITGALSVWSEHRRERSSLRAASRLVAAELRTIESRLHAAAGSGRWRALQQRPLPHEEWDEYQGALASQLTLQRWSRLQDTYGLIVAAGAEAERHRASDRLTEADRERLGAAAAAACIAAGALEAADDRPVSPEGLRGSQRVRWRHP